MKKSIFKEKGIWKEILRFIVTGGVATIIDFAVSYLVGAILPDSLGLWKTIIYTAAGFIVSLIVNYVLSLFWVYKNVDEKADTKSWKAMLLFVGLSCVGLGIGIGINAGFEALDNAIIHVDFQNWLQFIFGKAEFNLKQFFFAVLFFGVKTLVVLCWNYISRKKLIFKSPEVSETEDESDLNK